MLACAGFASMLSMRVCDPLVPLFAAEFGVTLGAASWTVFGFALAYGVMQLFYGPLGDRYGKLRVLTGAVGAGAACNAAIAISPNFEAVVALRMLAGTAGAGIVPLALAWLADAVPYRDRQATLARYFFATILGMSAGQWGGAALAQLGGWRLVFALIGLLFALIAWALRRMLRRMGRVDGVVAGPPPDARPLIAQLLTVLGTLRARQVLIAAMTEGAFVLGVFSLVPAYLQQRFQLTLAFSGAIIALYGVGGLVFAFTGARLAHRLGESGMVLVGSACVALSMVLLALGAAWWWSVPACLLGGFGFYMLHSIVQLNATQMVPELRGTAVSAFVAALFLGQCAGVMVVSQVMSAGYGTAVFCVGAMVLPMLGWWFRRGLEERQAGDA